MTRGKARQRRGDLSGPDLRKSEANRAGGETRRLPSRVERRIRLARVLLIWEALWPAIWPTANVAGFFVALALFGVFTNLPMGLHWTLLGAFALLLAWILWRSFLAFRWPSREAALRHLERVSGLSHQPLSAYEDTPAPGTGDAVLWRAHQRWVADRLRKLKLGLASPGLAAEDPYGLRAVVVLLLVIGIVGTGPGQMKRIAAALFPGAGAAKSFTVEAWITPPAYTGRAPIYLERRAPDAPPTDEHALTVPVNSTFSLRVHGPRNPPALQTAAGDRAKPELLEDMGDRNYVIDKPITGSTEFALTEGGRLMRGWTVNVIPDARPTIELTKPIQQTPTGTLRFAYKVADDYGVVSAEARIALVAPPPPVLPKPEPKSVDARPDAAPVRAMPHVTPPAVTLPLPTLRPKDGTGETYVDLLPHPWAGLPVTITLVAKDDAGQEGTTRPVTITLPAREFKKPLAAAIVEQRRALALDPTSTPRVARILDDLTQDADRYIQDLPVYLALRTAYWRITTATHDSDFDGIFDLLWATALHIEDGDVSLAEDNVRRARDALTEALAKGADNAEIERLMAELKDAFKRYMDALAARGGNLDRMGEIGPQDGQTIDRADLEKMLSAIGELARTGARDQAKAMLQQLQAIMENMRVPNANAGMTAGEQAMSQGVDRMGKLIDKQRRLMDETFRQGGGGMAEGEGASGGKPGKHGKMNLAELKRAQEELRKELDGVLRDLGKSGVKIPSVLDQAGKSMDNAGERLGEGRADRATGAQGQAIAGMRAGAQGLADQLMQSMSGRNGAQGRGNGSATDPLGRSLPNAGPQLGTDVAVPDKFDIERARAIIEELRRRASELGRPKIELDYLDRLLKRF